MGTSQASHDLTKIEASKVDATGVMDRSQWGFTGQPGDGYDVHFLMDLEFNMAGATN